MLDNIDVVVCELSTLVVEGIFVRDHVLEGRSVDLVCDWLAVDWVSHSGILDLECAVGIEVQVVAARLLDDSLVHSVAGTMWVELAAWHWVCFVVDDSVSRAAIKEWVHAQREDMLMVHGENTWMDTSAEWNLNAIIDGLRAQDTSCTDFVVHLTGLVKDEQLRASYINEELFECSDSFRSVLEKVNFFESCFLSKKDLCIPETSYRQNVLFRC